MIRYPWHLLRTLIALVAYKDILKQKSLIRINESPLFESIRVRKQWQEDNEIEFLDLNFNQEKNKKIK